MMLVIESKYIDDATIKLRELQRVASLPESRKLIEGIINDLNRNAVDLNQSVVRGMRDIKESY
jgi:hypothetical protein